MPEYLAPGVYVEEVDTGSKPIEGVSTSTSGVVGVTAWGPESVPTLVTGFADFQRQFGSYLNVKNYSNAWYLPHAVEGFFTNGGKRLYIVRVLPTAATAAATYLVDQALPSTVNTKLAVDAVTENPELTLDAAVDVSKILKGMVFKLDEGQFAEYVRIAEDAKDVSGKKTVKVELPLSRNHVKEAKLEERKILLKIEAIDRGNWGNTLQVTPDDDESLLETSVAADASSGQPKVTLNATQGIEPGSILDFFIQKIVSERTVLLTETLGKQVKRGTRVRLKAKDGTLTDWETIVTKDAKDNDKAILLESVEKLGKDEKVALFFDDGTQSEKQVESIEIKLNEVLGEDLRVTDTTAYARGSRVDTKLTADAAKNSQAVNLDRGAGVEPGATIVFRLLQEKVASIDKKVVTVDGTLDKAVKAGWLVRTREFKLRIDNVQTNPLTGQSRVVMSETHRYLSLHLSHSRYVEHVIGVADETAPRRPDGRTEGEGQMIRVKDMAGSDDAKKALRLRPELILGSPPIPLKLTGGNDQIATLADRDYRSSSAKKH
jgi:hypothetical protein